MLERFNVSRKSNIPASPSVDLRNLNKQEDATDMPFREVVGSLMWIANQTRPNIASAVGAMTKHSHEPKMTHWKAATKILNYLSDTADYQRRGSRCKD